MKFFLQKTAITSLGLFSGAMLLIACSLVPSWNSLSAEDYRTSFQFLGPYIGKFMVPLMVASILLSGICIFVDRSKRARWVLVTLLVFAIVPLYGMVQGPVNDLILGNSPLSQTELLTLRSKWVFLHLVRTTLGLSAFLISLFSRE